MKKKILWGIFVLCFVLFSFIICNEPTNAATTSKITMTEGDTRSITIPKKQRYYTSSESNACISSSAKYKSRKVEISALKTGTSTLTITSTKNKSYKYVITVTAKKKPADTTVEVPKDVPGGCPNCKKSGYLKTAQVTYMRGPVMTGYLKEPLFSYCEFRRMHFNAKLTEVEVQNLVKSWHGVILSKFKDSSWSNNYSNFGYDILVPSEYSGLTVPNDYQKQLASEKGLEDGFDVFDSYSLGDNTDNTAHYLTEWTIEEVIADPAKQVTVNTDVIECTNCGYKFVK